MRFEIVRASADAQNSKPPCDGVERDGEKWFIEVASVEALVTLSAREGNGIVVDADPVPRLTIYDDRLE